MRNHNPFPFFFSWKPSIQKGAVFIAFSIPQYHIRVFSSCSTRRILGIVFLIWNRAWWCCKHLQNIFRCLYICIYLARFFFFNLFGQWRSRDFRAGAQYRPKVKLWGGAYTFLESNNNNIYITILIFIGHVKWFWCFCWCWGAKVLRAWWGKAPQFK